MGLLPPLGNFADISYLVDSFTFVQENTINEMVQTISHRFNTHVKRLSLSASVVIIIITRLLATSRIITQYFNHLL